MRSQNLWDFALHKKIKTKQKDLATSCGAMEIVNHRPTLIIAETVVHHAEEATVLIINN